MSFQFRACTLDQPLLLAPSLQQWLPEEHLARFIADVTEQLDLSAIYSAYDRRDGRGQEGYHPLLMTRLLLYGIAWAWLVREPLSGRAMRMWRSAIWRRTSIRITTP